MTTQQTKEGKAYETMLLLRLDKVAVMTQYLPAENKKRVNIANLNRYIIKEGYGS